MHNSPSTARAMLKYIWFWRWAAGASACRMPEAMSSLALISLGIGIGNYQLGAIMLSVYTFSAAIFAGYGGKLFDRIVHLRIFLGGLSLAALAAHILLGVVFLHSHTTIIIFLLTALASIIPCGLPGEARAILARFPLDESAKHQAFIYDSIMTEVIWILGPVLVAVGNFNGMNFLGIFLMTACFMMTFFLLTPLEPRIRPVSSMTKMAGEGPRTEKYSVLIESHIRQQPSVQFMQYPAIWSGMSDALALGIVETGLIALLPRIVVKFHIPQSWAGIFVSGLALASILGGMIYARNYWKISLSHDFLSRIELGTICAFTVLATIASVMPLMIVAIVIIGLCISPFNTVRSMSIERNLPATLHSQEFSLQFSLYNVGAGISAAIIAFFHNFAISIALIVISSICTSILGLFLSALLLRNHT